MRWVKRGALVLIGLAIVGAIVWGMMPKPVASDIATVSTGDLRVVIVEEGRTRVMDRFTVVTPILSEKTRTLFKAGDKINKGDVICWLTPQTPMPLNARNKAQFEATAKATEALFKTAQARVTAAVAERDFAKREHLRKKDLLAKKHVSKEEVDAAFTRLVAAEASLSAAEHSESATGFQFAAAQASLIDSNEGADLTSIAVKSPVNGVVLSVANESAGTVSPPQKLMEIGDVNKMEIVVELLTRQAVKVSKNDAVEIVGWGGGDTLTGQVKRIEPGAFTKTSALGVEEQRTNVVISIDEFKASSLKDGYRVEVRIVIEEYKSALRVPSGALFNTVDGQAIFVVRDGEAHKVAIKTGASNGVETLVQSGLSDGEQVIVHPAEEVEEGTSIKSR